MANLNQCPEKFIEEVTSHLEANNFSAAIKVFNHDKHREYLKNNCWDLIPIFCKHITKESKLCNMELAVCSEELLHKLAMEANPEEAVLEFLDQMDEADIVKFEIVLKLLKIILCRNMTNRIKSLEWTLNSIRSYVEQYSYEEKLNDFEEEDEETFLSNENLTNIVTVMNLVISFYEHFAKEIDENLETKDLQILLSSRLLQMFDIVLPYVNLELVPELKLILWRTQSLILQLISNPMKLLEFVFYRALNVMKSKPNNNVQQTIDMNDFSENNLTAGNAVESINPFEDETIVSNLAYGMFFFSLLMETENEQIRLPMVYNPKYIMLSLIYVTVPFFEKKTNTAISNGLKFLNLLLDQLNDCLEKCDLYFSSHKSILIHLNNIMIFSQIEENRKSALTCFKKYIKCFNWEGRYLLLLKFRPHVSHPGTLGFLIVLLKEFVSTFLELPPNSQTYHKFLKYYKGKLLFDIIKKYCFLTNGSKTDLVENADHIISSLNALLYLLLRDKDNVTDIKRFIKKINSDFFNPLKKSIDSSRNYYEIKLKDLENRINTGRLTASNTDVEFELTVKNQTLPTLTNEQQITAYHSCMNAVDLIDLLLSRLMECI